MFLKPRLEKQSQGLCFLPPPRTHFQLRRLGETVPGCEALPAEGDGGPSLRNWAVTLPSTGVPREMGRAEAEPQSEGNTLPLPELWVR